MSQGYFTATTGDNDSASHAVVSNDLPVCRSHQLLKERHDTTSFTAFSLASDYKHVKTFLVHWAMSVDKSVMIRYYWCVDNATIVIPTFLTSS